MADKLTPAKRSWNMSRIKGKNTKPEMLVRKFLYSQGVRYRIHSSLPGRPDIVIKKREIILFINGCFWHGHVNCKDAGIPKSNTAFWQNKIGGNVERDRKNRLKLENEGWKVLTIWECEINKDFDKTMVSLMKSLS